MSFVSGNSLYTENSTAKLKHGGVCHVAVIILFFTLCSCSHSVKSGAKQAPPSLQLIGTYPCGVQPKQVIFTPDSRYIYIPLMEGNGFQIFDVASKTMKLCDYPREFANERYFVEGLFLQRGQQRTFLITQLTKASILEYDVSDFGNPRFMRSFSTGGSWPKVIAYCPSISCIAVSNWTSNSVVIIDYESGKVKNRIRNIPVPRGLAFTADGKFLLIASYEGGIIDKIDTQTWKSAARVYRANASMRHIVLSPDGSRCYVSNMMHNEVYEVSIEPFRIVHVFKVAEKPNTIDLSQDGRFLFVSNRGPNNPKGYTVKSLKPGEIHVIDTATRIRVNVIPGGTQPTGLDLSPDERMLASSNFQDDTISLYAVNGL
jgi:DNA-binding beta-propeller fold protein YncE